MTLARFKFDPLASITDKLDRAAAKGRFLLASVEAVNAVTLRTGASLQRGEIRDINLSPAYVKSKTDMVVAPARGPAKAAILTSGDLTVLGRFSPLILAAGNGAMRRAGPRAGLRNAGVTVPIRRSSPAFEPQWFVLPLRRGSQAGLNGFGVFVRDSRLKPRAAALREGKAGKRHIYGPSPYSLFKAQVNVQMPDILNDLERETLKRIGDIL